MEGFRVGVAAGTVEGGSMMLSAVDAAALDVREGDAVRVLALVTKQNKD